MVRKVISQTILNNWSLFTFRTRVKPVFLVRLCNKTKRSFAKFMILHLNHQFLSINALPLATLSKQRTKNFRKFLLENIPKVQPFNLLIIVLKQFSFIFVNFWKDLDQQMVITSCTQTEKSSMFWRKRQTIWSQMTFSRTVF